MSKVEEIRKIIELAILANGGEVHIKKWCQCDLSVNYFCEYCAIFNGLNEANTLLSSLDQVQKELEKERKKSDRSEKEATKWCEQSKKEQQDRANLRVLLDEEREKVRKLEEIVSHCGLAGSHGLRCPFLKEVEGGDEG